MKRTYLGIFVSLLFLALIGNAKAQSDKPPQGLPPQATAFTGAWLLDKEKSVAKNFPTKLKGYRMLVGESDGLLNVKSQVDGGVEVDAARSRGNSSPAVSNSAARSTSSVAGSAAGTGTGVVEKPSFGGTLALFFTAHEATYNLTGQETKVEIKQGDKVNGFARIKAKVDKNGKGIQFTTIRKTKTPQGEMEITTREWWKLADDGKSIRIDRTVETPSARDEVTMFLNKVEQ